MPNHTQHERSDPPCRGAACAAVRTVLERLDERLVLDDLQVFSKVLLRAVQEAELAVIGDGVGDELERGEPRLLARRHKDDGGPLIIVGRHCRVCGLETIITRNIREQRVTIAAANHAKAVQN